MSKKNIYLSINHTKFTSPNNKTATLSLFHISGNSSPLKHEQNIVIPWNKTHYNASGIILFNDYERRLTGSSLKEHPHKKPNIIIPEGNIEK